MSHTWRQWGALFVVCSLLSTGCVESIGTVDRTQPNRTLKSDLLDAEFYFLQTVVDAPYTSAFTFVGEQGTMERITWEITEDSLIAYRAYEYVANSDPSGVNGNGETGAPIAIYSIESHFDIRYAYDPITGERRNILEENTIDRPWYDREYMRVDWGQNLASDPNFLMLARHFDGLEVEATDFEQEPDGPNAPVFEWANGGNERTDPGERGDLQYMDITNRMFASPQITNYYGWNLPSCWLLQVLDGNPIDCAPEEITVRQSFMRIPEDRDYQPVNYTGDRMEQFGYFIVERPGYDEAYGLVEPARYRFAARHNLWAQSHRADDQGELVLCTSDAQCDDGRGSVCDLDWGRAQRRVTADRQVEGACTIPYRDRELRPIAYHLTSNFPADLLPEMQALEAEWDSAFLDTVASLRVIECQQTGGSGCESERSRTLEEAMFHICESPVPEGAPSACGEPGTVARIGDLRYHLMAWVNEPSVASPLGYGPSATDPLTGEIIAGKSNLYGAAVDVVAAFGRDLVRLLDGDLTEEEIGEGAPVDAWIAGLDSTAERATGRTADNHSIPLDGQDARRINAAMDFTWTPPGSANIRRGSPASPDEAVERAREASNRLHAAHAFGDGVDRGQAALTRLIGTEFEQLMVTDEVLMLSSLDPHTQVTEDVLDVASPLRAGTLTQLDALERARSELQHEQGVDFADFSDIGLLGLAREVRRAADEGRPVEWNGIAYDVGSGGNLDIEGISDMLRHPIVYGLALHEVGHTLGLRHNFSGSFDAVNYHPRYWELRDDGNARPRAWDPITDAEIDGRIHEFAYSTVMDYGNNAVVSDAHGIGHYDRAAIKMGYGDVVEVFAELAENSEVAWLKFIQELGWPVPFTLNWARGGDIAAYTYTDWLRLAGSRENIENRVDVPYSEIGAHPVLNDPDARLGDELGRVQVPYRFCSDEQADLDVDCYRYDLGADAYESLQSVIDTYTNYYIFNNFRRRRIGFGVNGVASRIHSRYLRKIQRANQSYALNRVSFTEAFGDSRGFDTFFEREDGMGAWTLAVGAGYQTLTRIITTPEPDTYGEAMRADGTMGMLRDAGNVQVDGFDGRFLETTWDFDAGYYWFDQLERVGYFYDKLIAISVLTDPTTYFIGRDTDADIRRYQISFANTFGPSVMSFFGGLLAEDWDVIAPRVQGDGSIRYPDPLEIELGDMGGVPVDPNASFSIQLYSAIYSMALLPQTYDQDYLNRARIWIDGGAESIETDRPLITFVDAESGLTYQAVSYLDDDGIERGVGAQLLVHANALEVRAAEGDAEAAFELENYVDNLDLLRRLTWQLGFGGQP